MGREETDRFVDGLDSPLAGALAELCAVVRDSDSRVSEELKWNSPSFFLTEHFATTNLRPGGPLLLVLHAGAKKKDVDLRTVVQDDDRLLQWKSGDRAILTFADLAAVRERSAGVQAVLRSWIAATQ